MNTNNKGLIYKNKIENNLIKIDIFLEKYDNFSSNYLDNLKAISSEDRCKILENRELKKDCYDTKVKRLEAIKRVKIKFYKLRLKVNEVLKLKMLLLK